MLLVLSLAELIGWGIQKWAPRFAVHTVLAAAILANFALIFGYFAAFEALWGGQTPGKKWMGLRVICDDGRPVTFFHAMVRNLIRLVDLMPVAAFVPSYFIGILSIFLNAKNRRLGDLAGGTVVVRERGWEAPHREKWYQSLRLAETDAGAVAQTDYPRDTTDRISPGSFDLIATFIRRRDQLEPQTRAHWAQRIRQKIEPEVGRNEWSLGLNDETYLEALHQASLGHPKVPSN